MQVLPHFNVDDVLKFIKMSSECTHKQPSRCKNLTVGFLELSFLLITINYAHTVQNTCFIKVRLWIPAVVALQIMSNKSD